MDTKNYTEIAVALGWLAYLMHSGALLVLEINIEEELERVNRLVIKQMVDAFSNQDIDLIMNLFSGDAIYYDMKGSGEHSNSHLGKAK